MLIRIIFFFLLISSKCVLYGQFISCKFTDSTNNSIEIVYLKISCNENETPNYRVIRTGYCTINFPANCNTITLQINAFGYKIKVIDFTKSRVSNDTIQIVLTKNDVSILTPVIVSSTTKPIIVKNDTTVYKVANFSDGTERKLDDLLERLPGIQVSKATGEIKFKGKPIETILLEGDNLFGSNYTLGSKNIDAKLVTEVEAIENYSDNYVLKGLGKVDEKVALNIKLNITNTQLSGNTELGYGINTANSLGAMDLNVNLIGLKQSNKFFTTFAYNNVGQNRSPIDYFGNNPTIEQLQEKKYFGQKFLTSPTIRYNGDIDRGNINSQFFGNYNEIFKINQKIRIRTNFFYVNNFLRNSQLFENTYFIPSQVITSDITEFQNRPVMFKGDVNIRYSISSKALFEMSISNTNESEKSNLSSIVNANRLYNSRLINKNEYTKFSMQLSKRIGNSTALQIEMRSSSNSVNQAYLISPSVFFRSLYNNDTQESDFLRDNSYISTTIHRVQKKLKYSAFVKLQFDNNNFYSKLFSRNDISDSVLNNNSILYRKPTFVQGANFDIDLRRFKLTIAYNAYILSQSYKDDINKDLFTKQNFFVEPSLKIKYSISKLSNIGFSYTYSQKNTNDRHIFSNPLLLNIRNVVTNSIDLNLINTNFFTLFVNRIDLYNQFDFGFSFAFQKEGRDYLPIYSITDTIIYTKFFQSSVNNRSFNFNLYATKYFPIIKSTVKLQISKNYDYYNNLLFANVIRDNISEYLATTLFFKTSFKRKFNFEIEANYTSNRNLSIGEGDFTNESFNSISKIIFAPKQRLKFSLLYENFLPNIKSNTSINFFDFNAYYVMKNEKIAFKIIARNLTNTLNFSQFQVTDFSSTLSQTSTLPRNIMLSVAFRL